MRVDLSSASKDERRVLEHVAGIPIGADYVEIFTNQSGLLAYLSVSAEPKDNGAVELVADGIVAPSLSKQGAAVIYILGLAQYFALNPDIECKSQDSTVGNIIRLLKLVGESGPWEL